MRSNAGMANRQGEVNLRIAQVSSPSTLAWLGLAIVLDSRSSVAMRQLILLLLGEPVVVHVLTFGFNFVLQDHPL